MLFGSNSLTHPMFLSWIIYYDPESDPAYFLLSALYWINHSTWQLILGQGEAYLWWTDNGFYYCIPMFLIFTLWKPSCAIFIFKININAKIFKSSWTNSSVPLCLTNRRPRIHQKKLIKILRKLAILWIIRTRNTLQDAVPQAVGKVDFWVSKCAEINSKREVKEVLDIINSLLQCCK